MRRVVRMFLKYGVDSIKLNLSGDNFTPDAPADTAWMTDAEVAAAMEEVRMRGKRGTAHARSAASVKQALRQLVPQLRAQDRVAQTEGARLAHVRAVHVGGLQRVHQLEQLVLASGFQLAFQLVGGVEMVFDSALVAARDEDHVADAGLVGFLDCVLDERLVDDGQHFLRTWPWWRAGNEFRGLRTGKTAVFTRLTMAFS